VLWVGSGQPSLVWVWVWKISLKIPNFLIFFISGQKNLFGFRSKSSWVKDGSVSYLLRVKKCSGWVGSGNIFSQNHPRGSHGLIISFHLKPYLLLIHYHTSNYNYFTLLTELLPVPMIVPRAAQVHDVSASKPSLHI